MKLYDVQFDPSDYGIIQKYDEIKSIYKMDLSPTIITLTSNIESGEVSKIIMRALSKLNP